MTAFSQLDLINKGVLSDSGKLILGPFERKYGKLYIPIEKEELRQGNLLVGLINNLIDQSISPFTMERLLVLLYNDFLLLLEKNLKNEKINFLKVGMILLEKMKRQEKEKDISENQYVMRTENHLTLKTRIISSNKPIIKFPISLSKENCLRGEYLLANFQLFIPEIKITVEEMIALRYKEIMRAINNGKNEILYAIVSNVETE